MNKVDTDLKQLLFNRGYDLTDKQYDKLKKYFIDNGYIKTFDEVVNENIEVFEIHCPRDFLNTEKIVADDNDYIKIGNHYFNLTWFEIDLKEYNIYDIIDEVILSYKFNATSIANDIINEAIEKEWCDIEKSDVMYHLNEDIEDIYYTIMNVIDKMIIINDDGFIERK